MRSIKTKIMLLMSVFILLTTCVVGNAGIMHAGYMMNQNATRIMQLLCRDKMWELNALMSRIEQSVQTVSDYSLDQITDVDAFQTDSACVDAFTADIEDILQNAASHTEGALAAYIRYNPDFTDPVSGLFFSRGTAEERFQKLPPTDLSMYGPSDTEHVGWYYIPASNRKPTWMSPYLNKNINVEMISYVIPLYKDDILIGVVGMDIDFGVMKNLVDDTSVFDSGYAFLTDGSSIVYHKNYMMGTSLSAIGGGLQNLSASLENHASGHSLIRYQLEGEDKRAVFGALNNGMQLVLTSPTKEIYAARNHLILQITLTTLLMTGIALLLTFFITRKMSKPLCELNEAAQKIARGDMNVTISCRSKDEIGTLAESFRKTVEQLSHYISYIQALAYRDPMTGVKSKTAYLETAARLESAIQIGRPEFAVAVFDINGLKKINDDFGHDLGDMHIIEASRIICRSFTHSPVYRIGGDEFAVILENADLIHYKELLAQFQSAMNEYNNHVRPGLQLLIARGTAVYCPETDVSYSDVFKRADTAMYRNKKHMKETGKEASYENNHR